MSGDPALVVTAPAYLDSRVPQPGGLFVAIAGERVDGHSYAAHAHAVLGSRPTSRPTVVVPDPVVALGRLARHVVAAVAPTVVAVTGTHGKTTTKDYLAALLPGAVASRGNQNNELGVPLTAVQLKADNDFLVLEIAARGVGHLSYLCDIAPPHVGTVLGVGSAHVGAFGSLELTAAAVSRRTDGLIVIDDTYNANPESMRAALQALATIGRQRGGRTVAVVGEMRELGAASAPAHAGVGAVARAMGVDIVLSVGEAAHAAGGIRVGDARTALAWLDGHLRPDDTVLVKASRAAGLDHIAQALRA